MSQVGLHLHQGQMLLGLCKYLWIKFMWCHINLKWQILLIEFPSYVQHLRVGLGLSIYLISKCHDPPRKQWILSFGK